jgi:addiction module HigA family antidote
MKKNLLPLTTPGEILNEEFLLPLGISQYRLAKDIGISARRINEIVHGKRAITPNTALRLGKYFGLSAHFWFNLQARYDLQTAERSAGFLPDIRPYRVLQAA